MAKNHSAKAERPSGTEDANKASGPSSSNIETVSNAIKSMYETAKSNEEVMDVDLEALIDHINELLQLYQEKKMGETSELSHSFWPRVKALFSNGMKQVASGLRRLIGTGEVAKVAADLFDRVQNSNEALTTAFLIVSYILDGFQTLSENKEECWLLLKEMTRLAQVVNFLHKGNPSRKQMDTNAVKPLTVSSIIVILEGSLLCCSLMNSSKIGKFFYAKAKKQQLSDLKKKVEGEFNCLGCEMGVLHYLKSLENKYTSLPELNIYPNDAVGIERPTKKILQLVNWESGSQLVAVIVHGIGGIGKSTLASAVYSKFSDKEKKNCKCIRVVVETNPTDESLKILQRNLIKDLKGEDKPLPDIRSLDDGRQHLGLILQDQPAFIYIDNVLVVQHLEALLPLKEMLNTVRKLRLLITTRDKGVGVTLPRRCRCYHQMEGISQEKAVQLVKKEMRKKKIDSTVLKKIINKCGGVPLFLKLIAGFIAEADDKEKAYDIFQEEIDRDGGHPQIFRGDDLAELVGYNKLRKDLIDPFLDICSYFRSGYRWHTVENIVGISTLNKLENRSLVKNDHNFVSVHDILLNLGIRKSEGTRIFSDFSYHLNAESNQDIHSIKGLSFKDDKGRCPISAKKLVPVSSSVRVLLLKNSGRTITEDKCDITFPELIYLSASSQPLPFDVSKFKKLKSLSYSPENPEELNLEMPSSLKDLRLNGRLYSHDDIDLHQRFTTTLTNLRSLALYQFDQLKKLPKELGSHENLISLEISCCANFVEFPENVGFPSLIYLKLSSCQSLKKLPKASELKHLKTLLLSGCENLQQLCINFEGLQSLKYLRLIDCPKLEAKWMEVIVNMKNLKEVDITGSEMLIRKWKSMKPPNRTSFRVITGKV